MGLGFRENRDRTRPTAPLRTHTYPARRPLPGSNRRPFPTVAATMRITAFSATCISGLQMAKLTNWLRNVARLDATKGDARTAALRKSNR